MHTIINYVSNYIYKKHAIISTSRGLGHENVSRLGKRFFYFWTSRYTSY